jgi:hypothetical protein
MAAVGGVVRGDFCVVVSRPEGAVGIIWVYIGIM